MIYGDNQFVTQEDYDWYYINKYGYGVVDNACRERLRNRASYIYGLGVTKVVDFGGGDSGLSQMISDMDHNDLVSVKTVGCGEDVPECDLVIAEHVLEHIYDLEYAMIEITNGLKRDGMLIVDVPDATMAIDPSPKMPILDFSQVHINHFRLLDMLRFMSSWGFELKETSTYYERNSLCRMYVFIKKSIGDLSREYVTKNISEKVMKLKEIDYPVCVWGFGDIASQCLAEHFPDVKYFVINDPAFKDATIKGLPVYDKPIDDLPVLVIAQSQKQELIERIKKGCDNEIIEI